MLELELHNVLIPTPSIWSDMQNVLIRVTIWRIFLPFLAILADLFRGWRSKVVNGGKKIVVKMCQINEFQPVIS